MLNYEFIKYLNVKLFIFIDVDNRDIIDLII